MSKLISKIEQILLRIDNTFTINYLKEFEQIKADLYAERKAGMSGKDFIFFYDFSNMQSTSLDLIKQSHEKARKYVNAQYKLPKVFRFSVPNIVSFFICNTVIGSQIIEFVQKGTRTMMGGEIHSVFVVDMQKKVVYGQGKSRVHVDGSSFVFKTIDPQNRAYYISLELQKIIFT